MNHSRLFKPWILALVALSGSFWTQSSRAEIIRLYEVEPGKVYRGSHPQNYEDLIALKNMGIRTILNLRNNPDYNSWQSSLAQVLGFKVINRPTASLFSPSDRHVDEIQAILNNPSLQPVFIHCKHGKDRTGLMVGIYRVETQGWIPQDAYKEMKAIGFNPILIGLSQYFWSRTEPYSRSSLPEISVH
ncbi:hypothetical protein EBZ37_09980 [bacterium]|nr:hypothetical protein [bacterium]